MKYLKLKFVLFFLPVVFSACGGGVSSAQSTPQSTADIFHGIKVPPDPGSAADATVAGVDSDGNGIRDDVDRALARFYGGNPKQYAAAQMSAKASQSLLQADVSTLSLAAVKDVVFASGKTGACVVDALWPDSVAASEVIDRVILLSYNTLSRQAHVKKIYHAVGQLTLSSSDFACP